MRRLRPLLALVIALAWTTATQAIAPCVRFDVVRAVPAEDISLAGFAAEEKLIRLRIPVSSLVRLGSEEILLQYLYVLSSSTQPFQIMDYSPKTELESNLAGNVSIERTHGESTTVGLKAYLPRDVLLQGDATANHGTDSSERIRYEQLPSLIVVSSSGTMQRGSAVYFKLKPSLRATLEGDKTFEIIARVPTTWRAGLLDLECQAFGQRRGLLSRFEKKHEDLVCGQGRFLIGVYLTGDAGARQRVHDFSQHLSRLRELATTHASEVNNERYENWTHKISAALTITQPRIPDRWLDEILKSESSRSFEQHLPKTIRKAAVEFHAARQRVQQFAR